MLHINLAVWHKGGIMIGVDGGQHLENPSYCDRIKTRSDVESTFSVSSDWSVKLPPIDRSNIDTKLKHG